MPKLLLADDSITIQRVIELTFSGGDVQVIAVSDGEEAIARIAADRPDIVLADIGMPKRSGYDVAAFVKGDPSLAHIPVLLLAGAFEPVDQARADQVRCDGVLVKPFEPQQVIARVRELVKAAGGGQGVVRTDGRELAAAPRVIDSRPIVEIPDARDATPPGADGGDSLDDYFDRLDAAFASLSNGTAHGAAATPMLDDLSEQVNVPTIDDLLGGVPGKGVPGDVPPPSAHVAAPSVEPPDSTPTRTAAGPAGNESAAAQGASAAASVERPLAESGRNVIADVFSALLAVEQGESAVPGRLSRASEHAFSSTGPARGPVVTDDLVDELTRRVLERLAPSAAKGVVTQIVSDVAERLVREEIARIRGMG
jgi:CheY-like chemotaxis protein